MKIVKRMISVLLMASMVLSFSACGNSSKSDTTGDATSTTSSTNSTSTTTDTKASPDTNKSYDKIVYAFVSFNNIPQDTSDIEEAINKITRDKIGVEVKLMPMSIADYTQKVNLALQGGEQIDVFHSLGDFSRSVGSNQAADLTNIMDTCAAETKALIQPSWFEATSKEGKIYGIPALKPIALQPMLIYREDIAQEIGLDMTQVKSLDDLTAVFEKVKAAYPDMTPLVPVNTGDTGLTRCVDQLDGLSDTFTAYKGVLLKDSTTVIDFYSTDEFKNLCNLSRSWFNSGLILKDAATTASTSTEMMSSGNAFAYIASYSYPLKDTAVQLSTTMNVKLGAVALGNSYLDTNAVNGVTWMVASTSKTPEAALKFLNLTYSDKDVVNLIIYGLEGRDYVKNADGSVSYPEGKDASTVPYTAQISCGIVGNMFNQYYMQGVDPESLVWEQEQNKQAKTSPAIGFSFDVSKVSAEYTAVTNVINQYLPGLVCGSIDPATELPNFISRLKEAGYDTILKEKQAQIDAWLLTKK